MKRAIRDYIKKHPFLLRQVISIARRFRFFYQPIKRLYFLYKSLLPDAHYHAWATSNDDECFVENVEGQEATLISVIVPTFNTVQAHLLEMVYSVVNQHYSNWELLLVNASSDKERKQAIRQCANIDSRIRVIEVEENKGISGNTNTGLADAKGEYIAFLDHDDILHACALHCMADAILKYQPGIIYTDEDKINHDGNLFFGPLCKPRWSPDLLRNVNYINHFTVIRSEYLKKVEGLRPDLDGAQDYDLLLRVIDECKPSIYHIARILYHWRAAESSTAQDISNKQYIFKAGSRAIREHLKRNHIPAKVRVIKGKPGFYQVLYEPPKQFSIVIGPVDRRRERVCAWWLEKLLNKVDTKNVELVVGEWYKEYAKKVDNKPKITWVKPGGDYWQSAAQAVSSEVLICFQEMATPLSEDSLLDLVSAAFHNQSLATAPIVIGPDKTIIDAGFVEADFGLQRLFAGYKLGQDTYFGTTDWVRNTMGLTMGVFATRKNLFHELIHQMKGPVVTTFDLHEIYMDQVEDYPMCLLWAHSAFIYKGTLQTIEGDDTYFNTGLTQASSPIHMQVSTWGRFNERSPE